MSPDLPRFIEPSHLADVRARLKGKLDIGAMDRLREIILDASGPVEVEMTFDRDAQGVIRITGDYRATVTLRCQRCLELMTVTLANSINIGLVTADSDADEVAGDFEPVAMEGGETALWTLIEDELLLGLPMAPMHAPENCPAAKEVQDLAPDKASPFAVLKNMKTR